MDSPISSNVNISIQIWTATNSDVSRHSSVVTHDNFGLIPPLRAPPIWTCRFGLGAAGQKVVAVAAGTSLGNGVGTRRSRGLTERRAGEPGRRRGGRRGPQGTRGQWTHQGIPADDSKERNSRDPETEGAGSLMTRVRPAPRLPQQGTMTAWWAAQPSPEEEHPGANGEAAPDTGSAAPEGSPGVRRQLECRAIPAPIGGHCGSADGYLGAECDAVTHTGAGNGRGQECRSLASAALGRGRWPKVGR